VRIFDESRNEQNAAPTAFDVVVFHNFNNFIAILSFTLALRAINIHERTRSETDRGREIERERERESISALDIDHRLDMKTK